MDISEVLMDFLYYSVNHKSFLYKAQCKILVFAFMMNHLQYIILSLELDLYLINYFIQT